MILPVRGSPFVERVTDEESLRINLSWILRLRWGAIGGQLLTILYVDRAMEIDLPLVPLFVIVSVELASNFAGVIWQRRKPAVREWMVGAILAADVLLLTGLLYFTGGPFNPFSFLYLIHIALAAVVLRSWWTWSLVGLSVACLGTLFLDHEWLDLGWHGHPERHTEHVGLHLRGMWVAMAVAGVFIVYFVTRVARDLARRDAELARARALAERGRRVTALATLAAGAAHEISTPLSTILVVTRELERALERSAMDQEAMEDVRLIRREVERCRSVLQQMAADVGQGAADGFEWIEFSDLIGKAAEGACDPRRLRLAIAGGGRLYGPARALVQAVRNIIKNAGQASAPDRPVDVRVRRHGSTCTIEVEDAGPGMTPDVLDRAGEPFFTTKEPGQGSGLGLFLTRAILESLGGGIEIDSSPLRGTCVRLTIPVGDPAAICRMEGRPEAGKHEARARFFD